MLAAHLRSEGVGRVIYGAVIGLALVVALQAHPPSASRCVAALGATALTVGLAEIYSELIGSEARTRAPLRASQVRATALAAVPVVAGAGFPAVFFLLATAGAIDLDLAFNLSKWSGLGLLCVYGFIAGRVSGWGMAGALVHSAAAGLIGGILIGLKALLH